MGSTSSKFKKYLQHGDEFAAMQIYQNSPELRKNLDPNMSYGENHNHNTALHYAAKHGMKHLLRTFLNDLGGNPNKKNGANETVLHSACQLNHQTTKSFSAQERRAACVQLLLHWKGGVLLCGGGGREKVDLAAEDKEGNTGLHCAALAGLKRCVELMLAHGAPLFAENHDRLTPCDLAMKGSHHEIARLLESRMVFADTVDTVNEDEILNEQEVYSGLRSQDLQEAKDQLLVDTSDMLKIPLFTAEALLRNNEWSRELLLEKWMKDPIECCQVAGVKPPSSIVTQNSFDSTTASPEAANNNRSEDPNQAEQQCVVCEICCLSITTKWELSLRMSCKHVFCEACWETYLTNKIQDGDAHHILCPAYQCHILVPVELIEKLVQPDIAKRYLQFDIKAFVESNKSIKWCPIAGCGRAVRLPEAEHASEQVNKAIPVTSHAVDCGNAHFFCWECLGEAHAPCGCKQWQEWQMKIAEVKPEELQASCSGSEEAANFLWLVTNAKPCPNCKSPIQKNEGCNHMKCSKCKFDFCWVCQESWKQHSSATGGYFRCNRFEAVHKADEKQGVLITEAMDRNNQMQEMSRFLHFYMRFRNHENSQKLEEPLLVGVRQKMELLALSLGLKQQQQQQHNNNTNTAEKGTKFIEEGIRELLKARRVLCGSYAYGYYLKDDGYNKTIFEFMQNELEEVTEKLSEMIARPYLKTPKTVIVQTTALTRRKRHEFIRAVAQGLIPPETPPSQRKAKKRRYFDIGLSQTNTWLRECQWPEYDSDEDCDVGGFQDRIDASSNSRDSNLKCPYDSPDMNMELVIALEMSRLQMIEDRMKQQSDVPQPQPQPQPPIQETNESDDQLKLAIQLSLQESLKKKRHDAANDGTSYQKTCADLTVDYFLKSLANHKIDLKNLDVGRLGSETWGRKEKECLFRPCNGSEDGRFRISDIHEKGFGFGLIDDEYDDVDEGDGRDEHPYIRLKRSHSTGDLCMKRSSLSHHTRIGGRMREVPRYHLDSDQSSQQDEDSKPEDIARRMLALPSTSVRTKQLLLLHHTYPEEDYQGQSSIEDTTTTTSDSINVDMEVCNILLGDEKGGEEMYVNLKTEDISKSDEVSGEMMPAAAAASSTSFASLKAKLCSAHLPKTTSYLTRIAVTKSIGLISDGKTEAAARRNSEHLVVKKEEDGEEEEERIGKNSKFSKSTGFLIDRNLRIKICPEHHQPHSKNSKANLETDSSNEYESETGIPKSPTLYISGVSISRTPEPKSPGISMIIANNNHPTTNQNGRQSRSSSLSVPPSIPLSTTTTTTTTCSTLNLSSTSLNHHHSTSTPEPSTANSPNHTVTTSQQQQQQTIATTAVNGGTTTTTATTTTTSKENGKSKSASEPEREREMFCFPKSSTDGALSSVLHVQESNLSSDDFHEALFLLERSPKSRDSKRRKKLKKKLEKEKEKGGGGVGCGGDERKEELSSAL